VRILFTSSFRGNGRCGPATTRGRTPLAGSVEASQLWI
jgi:hypothetical protein